MFQNLSDKPVAEVQNEQAKHWEEIDLLKLSVKSREGAKPFVFYEGPPTANGKPGIHHLMARTLKDSVNRYKTMRGYQVKRKGGWDTHGLPVEIEVEKKLGMSGKQDIEDYGIKEFNQQCRESVFTYTNMWKDMSDRMAYMVDMDNPYITYTNDYIESEWWIIKQFFDAGLIYEGHKILPYCPRCETGLASHEVAQGYKDVKVNTIVCKFKRKGTDNEYFLAWTTTAWTLPSNVALAVGPDIEYVKAKITSGDNNGNYMWVAKELASKVLENDDYEVVETLTGKEMVGWEYEQLMPFCVPDKGKKAFIVVSMDYVSVEDGTGIVHTAPAFGEDDYQCGRKYGLAVLQPVDERGLFTETPWAGRFIMEDGLDVDIIKYLALEDKIYSKQKLDHNYPHCWRCATPLVYYAHKSWYIEMTKLKEDLVANNNTVNWFPPYVGEKRFGNWLSEVKDWAISRSRFWGTPIPIWKCECGEMKCLGSVAELIENANQEIDETIDLHRPFVDDITITCPKCGKKMHRIPDVMDCWFDSGAMPYAQWHYPFEHSDDFDEELFPADFICEGIDQTRGWFYSLMAISTFIKKRAPYKNVLVNDLILDKEGKKMSKHVGNTVSPFEMLDKYGADALRWYLVYTSPVWTPTKFDEVGVNEVVSKVFNTLKNTYNFFCLYANIDHVTTNMLDVPYEVRPELDRWIMSKYNKLIKSTTESMDAYDHMRTVRAISEFIVEDFSNWYIRRARRRFFAEGMEPDKMSAYATTYEVLIGLAKMMAPIAPFISDEIYTKLTDEPTVHTALYPECDAKLVDEKAEERMDLVRILVNLGRSTREQEKLKVRQPLNSVIVDGRYKSIIGDLTDLIKEELNVKAVIFEDDLDDFMNYSIKPNFRTAGPIFGKEIKDFATKLATLDAKEVIAKISSNEAVRVQVGEKEVELTSDLLDIRISAKDGFAVGMENNVFTILDTTLTQELIDQGYVREIISKIQQLRKQANLDMMDNIKIMLNEDEDISAAVAQSKDFIMSETIAKEIVETDNLPKFDINGHETGIKIEKI